MNVMKISRLSLAFACAAGLGLAGCSKAGSTSNGGGATYDTALEDTPCAIVTTQMVATAFEVPVSDVEQSNVMSSRCSYEMESNGDTLDVEVSVDAFETTKKAASYFRRATRNMSSEEISDAMNSIQKEAGTDLGTAAQKDAAESIGSGVKQGGGIQFQDVEGVGDQARLNTFDGTLNLQAGNLLIDLRSYYGPAMPIPDVIEPGTMMKVQKSWMQDTMEARETQSVKLAKIALDAL